MAAGQRRMLRNAPCRPRADGMSHAKFFSRLWSFVKPNCEYWNLSGDSAQRFPRKSFRSRAAARRGLSHLFETRTGRIANPPQNAILPPVGGEGAPVPPF